MSHTSPSALITDQGQRVLLRLNEHFFDLSQNELRAVLELPAGEPGVGISIDGERISFEFCSGEVIELSARQLQRRLAKQPALKR